MEKLAQMSILLDMYGALLTKRQRDVMELYYFYDLSLSEIAENMNITRQGVHDLIKRGEQSLLRSDDKLGFYDKLLKIDDTLDQILKRLDYLCCDYKNIAMDDSILQIKRDLFKIKETIF